MIVGVETWGKWRSDKFCEAAYAFRCGSAYDGDAGRHFGRVRVNVIDWYALTNVMEKGGSRIYDETRADDHEDVGGADDVSRGFEVGDGFLKEYDVGTDGVAGDDCFRGSYTFFRAKCVDLAIIIEGADFHKLTVKMENV